MRRIIKVLINAPVLICSLLLLFSLVANLVNLDISGMEYMPGNEGPNPNNHSLYLITGFLFFVVLIIVILSKVGIIRRLHEFVRHAYMHSGSISKLVIFFVIVGFFIIIRLMFILRQPDIVADMMTNYYTAGELAGLGDGAELDKGYLAWLSYVLSYDAILAFFMGIFGKSYTSFIVMNTLCDLISAVALYYVTIQMTGRRTYACVASLLWLGNPFNILFCALALTSTVVNTFLCVLLLLSVHFIKSIIVAIKKGRGGSKAIFFRMAIFGLLIGLVCGAGNTVRPNMFIVIIALTLTAFLCVISVGTRNKICVQKFIVIIVSIVVSLAISVLALNAVSIGYYDWVKEQTSPYIPAKFAGGHSMNVGADTRSNGHYASFQVEEIYEADAVTAGNLDMQVKSDYLYRLAIEKWKNLGFVGALKHMYKKSFMFAGDNQYYWVFPTWDGFDQTTIDGRLTYNWTGVFYIGFCALALAGVAFHILSKRYSALRRKNQAREQLMLMPVLTFVGLWCGFMLTEVQPRYFIIMFPCLTVFGVMGAYYLGIGQRSNSGRAVLA
jgi:hypothetical protein